MYNKPIVVVTIAINYYDCDFAGLSRLNITSGTRTYRIPSPTRPLISRNAFQPSPPRERTPEPAPHTEISSLDNDPTNQKGFYISFDNEQPKRPKPPLRAKRSSPKKERSFADMTEEGIYESRDNLVVLLLGLDTYYIVTD